MRVSREQVTENRRTILGAASRLFRERGFEAVTVADVVVVPMAYTRACQTLTPMAP